MMKLFPVLEEIKSKLKFWASVTAESNNDEPPNLLRQLLANHNLEPLKQNGIHVVCCVACLLHPSLSFFHFVLGKFSNEWSTIGEAFVRRIVTDESSSVQFIVSSSPLQTYSRSV